MAVESPKSNMLGTKPHNDPGGFPIDDPFGIFNGTRSNIVYTMGGGSKDAKRINDAVGKTQFEFLESGFNAENGFGVDSPPPVDLVSFAPPGGFVFEESAHPGEGDPDGGGASSGGFTRSAEAQAASDRLGKTTSTDGSDGDDDGDVEVRDNTAALKKLAGLGSFMSSEALGLVTNLLAEGIADDFSLDADGNLHYSLNGEVVGTIPSSMLRNSQQTFNNELDIARYDLEAQRLQLSEEFKREELAVRKKIAEEEAQIAREQIEAEKYMAEGNWQNALDVQTRIDEREKANRQLERDLANLDAQFKQQQLDLQKQSFELEKVQFMTQLSTSPTGMVDLFNLSRGLPAVGMGGAIPGGFTRFGGSNPFMSSLFAPEGPGIAPQVGDEPGAEATATPTSTVASSEQALAGGAGGEGLENDVSPNDVFALPPAIAAAFAGLQPTDTFGAAQVAAGGVPLLSEQTLAQMTPSEREFVMGLVQLTGQNPDDFNAMLAEVGTPQRRATSRSA